MVDGVARGFFDIAKNQSFLDPEEEKYSNMPTDWSRLDPQNTDLGYWDYRSRMGQLGTIVEENPAAQPDTSDNVSSYKTFDSSLGADLSQGHGVASDPYRQQALIDSSLAAKHQDRGMELIRSALYKGPTADEQSNATMMKIAPSLGGAILGAIIGSPKLSPHSKFTLDELNKNPTGISGGLQIGNLYGEKDSQEYLAKLKAAGEADAAENQMLAKSELSQADDAQKEASILTREGLNADKEIQLKQMEINARKEGVLDPLGQSVYAELTQAQLEGRKPNLTPDQIAYASQNPKVFEAIGKAIPDAHSSLEKALPPDIRKRVVDADSMGQKVPELLYYYNNAVKDLKPNGVAGAITRGAFAELPASVQGRLKDEILPMAMEVSRTQNGGRPNMQEVQGVMNGFISAVDSNDFNRKLANLLGNAQKAARSSLEFGSSINPTVKAYADQKSSEWENDYQSLFGSSDQGADVNERIRKALNR